MRVLVTGATGLLGFQVCRAAADDGHDVVALVRDRRSPLAARLAAYRPDGGGRVTLARGDLTDDGSLHRAAAGAEGLVHCAALYAFGAPRADAVARTNMDGTRAVLEAAAHAGVRRVVVTSSSVTCGSSLVPEPRTEADRLGIEPTPAYYRSKVDQERVALEVGTDRGIEVVLALPTVVLGGPYSSLAPSNAVLLRYLLDPTRSTYPGGANVVDARDAAAGHLLLLAKGTSGERYLLGGQDLTWRSLHRHVAELTGLPGPFLEVNAALAGAVSAAAEAWAGLTGGTPLSTAEEAATVGRYYWYSHDRAAALGYAPRLGRETVASGVAWLLAGDAVPRWVREALHVSEEVRLSRPLVPRPLREPVTGEGTGKPPWRRGRGPISPLRR
jgi:dihydroflavonol-4-reductase